MKENEPSHMSVGKNENGLVLVELYLLDQPERVSLSVMWS
jgi:hypothetical protein